MHILAYIDPGAGALIWQSMIGIFVGMLFYLRRTRKWIGGMMGKVFNAREKASNSGVDVPMNKGKMETDHL
jgi:hypothetical protein